MYNQSKTPQYIITLLLFLFVLVVVRWGYSELRRPAGIRIQAAEIQDPDGGLHWKWTVTGGRYWAVAPEPSPAPQGNEHITKLYLRNEGVGNMITSARDGNVFVYDWKFTQRQKQATGMPDIHGVDYSLHIDKHTGDHIFSSGSSGGGYVGNASLRPANIVMENDTTVTLPARVTLATIGNESYILELNNTTEPAP